jgi:protein phosphatase PTC1
VGDARIVLCRNGKALRLSYDHKGSDENEGKRIANAGGLILNNRVNGVLAVTRALGDAYMKDLVTGHPYTTETVIQPDADEFIILACDGVRISVVSLHHIILTYHSFGTSAPIKKPSTSFAKC